jgi:hypothetical protein
MNSRETLLPLSQDRTEAYQRLRRGETTVAEFIAVADGEDSPRWQFRKHVAAVLMFPFACCVVFLMWCVGLLEKRRRLAAGRGK